MEQQLPPGMGDESAEGFVMIKPQHFSFRMQRFQPSVVAEIRKIRIEIEVPVEPPVGKGAVTDFNKPLR